MTLEEPLQAARASAEDDTGRIGEREWALARGILDLLGESAPCGWPEPRVANGEVELSLDTETGGPEMTPAELRAMCAVWLHACDEAEAKR